MGIRQFDLGMKHGREGIRHMAHRNLKRYDSTSDQASYDKGYKIGWATRYQIDQKIGLDYSKPLNNRLFSSNGDEHERF